MALVAEIASSLRASDPDWDRFARVYDWQLGLERQALVRALELADVRPEERLLDLGTGTGALLRELARRPERPRVAVGIDTSQGMLARVRDLPPGWEVARADIRSLPFPDASFEVATASYLLHLLPEGDLRRALAETRRVLVRGGRLVTVTPVALRSVLARPHAALANGTARFAPRLFGGLRLLDPREALVRAGFTLRRSRYVAAGYPSLCVLAEAR